MSKGLIALGVAMALALGMTACSKQTTDNAKATANSAGQDIKHAAKDAGKTINDAAKATGKAVEDATK